MSANLPNEPGSGSSEPLSSSLEDFVYPTERAGEAVHRPVGAGLAWSKRGECFGQVEHIARLQEALSFWMPYIGGNDEQENMLADDVWLLAPWYPDYFKDAPPSRGLCASERGWITLNTPPAASGLCADARSDNETKSGFRIPLAPLDQVQK